MAEGLAPLAVWCFDRQAGALTQSANGMEFAYATEWVADEMPPLSQSLPLDGRFDAAATAAFFGGLLPEGEPRRHLARLLGVGESNDYSMLAMIAGDTAGASGRQRPLAQDAPASSPTIRSSRPSASQARLRADSVRRVRMPAVSICSIAFATAGLVHPVAATATGTVMIGCAGRTVMRFQATASARGFACWRNRSRHVSWSSRTRLV